jgi:hypothetical protein
MINRFACLILVAVTSCTPVSKRDTIVVFTFRNESQHTLNWVSLEEAKIEPVGGVLSPGDFKTTLDLVWKNDKVAKLTFIDYQTRKPYSIPISFEEVTRDIVSGKCRHVVVSILSYDTARVGCK